MKVNVLGEKSAKYYDTCMINDEPVKYYQHGNTQVVLEPSNTSQS